MAFLSNHLTIAAVLPAVVLLIYVYKKDRLEKESGKTLFRLLLFGAASTFLAIITETIGTEIFESLPFSSETAYYFWYYTLVVGLSEEGFKHLFLKKATWKNREFNCTFDGVVYAVFVSLGFALVENISYVYSYGFSTAVVRAFTAVPGHACFGVLMGVYYACAKRAQMSGRTRLMKYNMTMSLLVPVFVHGLYDFTASIESEAAFWIVIITLMVSCFRKVKRASEQDTYIAPPTDPSVYYPSSERTVDTGSSVSYSVQGNDDSYKNF